MARSTVFAERTDSAVKRCSASGWEGSLGGDLATCDEDGVNETRFQCRGEDATFEPAQTLQSVELVANRLQSGDSVPEARRVLEAARV